MGMDQWLMAKTTARAPKGVTGVCSGVFGMVPTAVADDVELCYLRKGYDQHMIICDLTSAPEDEHGNIYITKDELLDIMAEAKRILAEHKFSEDDEYDETYDDPKFDPQGTWMAKTKWQNLIKGIEDGLKILEEDPDAKIYYHMWN